MNTADLTKLRDQAAADHTTALSRVAQIDEQLKTLREQRKLAVADLNRTRGALKFAEYALAPTIVAPPKTSPALERAKAALAAAGPSGDVPAAELEALIEHTTGTVAP